MKAGPMIAPSLGARPLHKDGCDCRSQRICVENHANYTNPSGDITHSKDVSLMAKRFFDLVTSASALVILAVPIALLALVIRLVLGSPVLFRQQRPGRHGRIFELVKFRTMLEKRDAAGELLPDEQRISRFGQMLRRTSLDELPELWNVLKGEMSLVGPRPLLPQYLPLYTEEQARRHEVLPGLTGHAQVNGRNDLSWDERFLLDVWYVDNRSFWLDLKILMRTFVKVLRAEGVSKKGFAIGAGGYFTGSEPSAKG